MNTACLAKLDWKMQTDGNDYWCRVMRGKYEENNRSSRPEAKVVDSSLWKEMVKIRPKLQRFIFWSIGNGQDIDAWSDAWTEEELCLDQHIEIPPHLIAILPPHEDSGSDERVGVGDNKSEYFVATMYNNICGFRRNDESVMWSKDRGAFYMGELQTWINYNLNNIVQWTGRIAWRDCWAFVCHCLWSWRNREQHEDGFLRPYRPVQHIMTLAHNYMQAANSTRAVMERGRSISLIAWIPPKTTFVKLNTDGAYKENQVAGCGGVIRGTQGEWLGGFAKHVELCSAFVAELWGVLEGLRYAHRLGFTRVELNIDSETVIKVIRKGRLSSSVGNALAKQIWRMLEMEWVVEITHTYAALFFDSCPSQISEICKQDREGNTIPRLVPL
ncbi:ribonuclease H protein [Trifolium medium]|uniref:Ribonuclease H protein n=1 Tax=Trifolium medium TaxID=97028 RepID=A0A392M135_9FABA|nr:ribonuclease H protein [Trifolium medium]